MDSASFGYLSEQCFLAQFAVYHLLEHVFLLETVAEHMKIVKKLGIGFKACCSDSGPC